ncbi:hypothetical protein [Streptomyces sp. NPDC054952]
MAASRSRREVFAHPYDPGPAGAPGGARGRWIAHQVLDGELVVLVVEVGDRRDAYRRI